MNKTNKIKNITFFGMLLAVVVVLSYLESLLPAIPGLPPGVKLGLSNVATMLCIYIFPMPLALLLILLKSAFVMITRGAVGGFISLSGGLLSVLAMALMVKNKSLRGAIFGVSVCGAVAHNIGQLLASYVVLRNEYVIYYFPVLLFSGAVFGVVTALVFKTMLPVLRRTGIDPGV